MQPLNAPRVRAQSIRERGEALREYPEVLQLEFINNADFGWGILPFDSVPTILTT